MLKKFRLVPATIFVASLMLTMKVVNIYGEYSLSDIPFQLSSAAAQDQQNEAKTPEKANETKSKDASPSKESKTKPGKKKEEKQKESEKNEDNPDNDPTLFTQAEIDLLQELADRREQIERMSKQISLREGLMKAAEKRISKRVAELTLLQKTIQDLIKTHDDQQESKMASLVKIYEAMKPKDAARIFEQLDLDTLLIVAERMKERRLAPVMAQMNPEKAKDITVQLSKLRELPLPGTLFVK